MPRFGFNPKGVRLFYETAWEMSDVENGERRMEKGEWRMEKGEWRMENGEWKACRIALQSLSALAS
jgi:hypothetical protein